MKVKFQISVFALAAFAAGSACADMTLTGTIADITSTQNDNNGSVWAHINDSTKNCNGAGAVAILRTGPHLGSGAAAEKTYSNIYNALYGAKLAGKTVQVNVDTNCSIKYIIIN